LDRLMTMPEAIEYLDSRLKAAVAAAPATSSWSEQMIAQTWNTFALRTIQELTIDETIDCLEAGRRLLTVLARAAEGPLTNVEREEE
jgi:hypothetical protein